MAGGSSPRDPEDVTSPDSPVADLAERRLRADLAAASVAAAPVRHLPAELLEALQGSWGTPEELGLTPTSTRSLRVVAG
jgi:hypothetical protein